MPPISLSMEWELGVASMSARGAEPLYLCRHLLEGSGDETV